MMRIARQLAKKRGCGDHASMRWVSFGRVTSLAVIVSNVKGEDRMR